MYIVKHMRIERKMKGRRERGEGRRNCKGQGKIGKEKGERKKARGKEEEREGMQLNNT